MIVRIVDGAVGLEEADVFTRFHVAADEGTGLDGVVAALAGHGHAAPDDHVWIRVESLRAWAEPTDADWDEGFSGMLAYASSKGWTDESGTHILAHIET